jgi:hypothetical protein
VWFAFVSPSPIMLVFRSHRSRDFSIGLDA